MTWTAGHFARILRVASMRCDIALSMHADKRFLTAMQEAGASGYLLKDNVYAELAAAIRRVAGGQTCFPSDTPRPG